jgi:hypothetical protein
LKAGSVSVFRYKERVPTVWGLLHKASHYNSTLQQARGSLNIQKGIVAPGGSKIYIVTYRLKARSSGRKEMAVAMERLGKHVPAATNTHATIEELLKTVFSMQSMPFSTQSIPRLYSKDQWDKPASCSLRLQSAVRV